MCSHIFHTGCLDKWLKIHNTCPNCREVIDEPKQLKYPSPAVNSAGNDPVYVGRIREDISYEKGLNLWIVSDNIRKGAALNSVQIAEKLIKILDKE